MSSETSMVAADFRLQDWAAQIRGCQNRPAGMSVVGWCACHGITKANYYYWFRRVRKACLETIQGEMPAQQIVPVQLGLLQREQKNHSPQSGLDVSIKGFFIYVIESTFMPLLSEVLKMVQHTE